MRHTFFNLLHAKMAEDPRLVFLTGDLGFGLIEPIQRDFPDRFYNMQAAEFTMVGAAIGMAYSGKIPIVYSITPFTVLRPFELLRTYINHENIPVRLVGTGRDDQYKGGISHYAGDIKGFLDLLPRIRQHWPADAAALNNDLMTSFLYDAQPAFLSLSK